MSHISTWVFILFFVLLYLGIKRCYPRTTVSGTIGAYPGDISMLIMVMMIFCIEFVIHYSVDAHWAIADSALFKFAAITLSGLIAGTSIGKNVSYFLKYYRSESVNLNTA